MTGTVIHALAMWATLLGVASGVETKGSEVAPPPDAATRAMGHVSEGARLRSQGDVLPACRHFRYAVGLTPTWPMARLELGRCLRLLGDPLGDAAAHLEVARVGLPDRATVLMELGLLAEDRGDEKAARAWYRKTAELEKGSEAAELGLARLGLNGTGLASFEHARRLVRADPEDPAARRAFGEASAAAGFAEQALEAFSWLADRARPSWRAKAAKTRLERRHDERSRLSTVGDRGKRSRRRR
jgi:tetratricopeptide (TPR) repeat protein